MHVADIGTIHIMHGPRNAVAKGCVVVSLVFIYIMNRSVLHNMPASLQELQGRFSFPYVFHMNT